MRIRESSVKSIIGFRSDGNAISRERESMSLRLAHDKGYAKDDGCAYLSNWKKSTKWSLTFARYKYADFEQVVLSKQRECLKDASKNVEKIPEFFRLSLETFSQAFFSLSFLFGFLLSVGWNQTIGLSREEKSSLLRISW